MVVIIMTVDDFSPYRSAKYVNYTSKYYCERCRWNLQTDSKKKNYIIKDV